MSLQDNRREYDYGKLTRESLSASPFEQFTLWMEQAIEAGIQDPTAMSVATVSAEGKPWQRMVLLKDFDQRGFVFYTNLGSRKAQEIAANAQVSLHFPWLQLDRQVIVGGRAERLSTVEVMKYFLSRPKGSQLAAWASKQSSRINSRQALETQFAQIKEKFAEGEIPLPDFWGGFRVVPEEIEFWQGGEMRLHDRFSYLRSEDGRDSWEIGRLSP
jgi:pyridoxamine 5'-phosphate oxidase